MKLVTSMCVIRSYEQTESDVKNLSLAANNKNVWNNLRDYFPHPYTENDAKDFIASSLESEPETTFAITIDNNVIGNIGINLQKDIHKVTAEIGYWIAEEYWEQGILTNALKAFTPYIFNTFTDIHRIHTGVLAYNTGSMRVLEKAGFMFDCVFRKALIKNGVIYDEYRYSKLRD